VLSGSKKSCLHYAIVRRCLPTDERINIDHLGLPLSVPYAVNLTILEI
jgi:hypothetical protein